MTGSPYKKGTDTEGRRRRAEGGGDWSDAATSHGMPRIASTNRIMKKIWKSLCPRAIRGMMNKYQLYMLLQIPRH